MGNCVRSRHRVTAQEEIERDPKREPTVPEKEKKKDNEKRVRFRSEDHVRDEEAVKEGGDGAKGVVRIRVVVTREELKRILSSKDRSDDLLSALTSRSRSIVVSDGSRDDDDDNWRPALESIPEDQ